MNLFTRYPISIWPLVCALCVLLLTALGDEVRIALRYARPEILDWQVWRLFMAHWVHLGWEHALLNSGGFLLLAWMQPVGAWSRWVLFYVIASFAISLHLHYGLSIYAYVGASGVLHGLLMLGAYFSQWLEPWRKWLMIALISAKLIWEQTPWYSDQSIADVIGGFVVVDAHFIGGMAGLLIILWIEYRKGSQEKS